MANEYLRRTPTSTGNRKVWTLALWLKRNIVAGDTGADVIFNAANTAANSHGTDIRFRKDNTGSTGWNFYDYNANAFTWGHYGSVERRDSGNWFHAMFVFDSTKSTSSDRVRVYINGILDNNYQSSPGIDPSKNYETYVNSITAHYLGVDQFAGSLTISYSKSQFADVFLVDGQALTPDVFGFYKQGKGYISAGSTQATDFRPGQWVPKTPRVIKTEINRRGGFGVNGFYLPMNDSSNFGADFHTTPNSIITLKGENLPQPRNGAPTTTDAYVSQLRSDPYAANLVLAVPGISTATGANLITNGNFDSNISGWTTVQATTSWQSGVLRIIPNASVNGGVYQSITTEVGKRYTVSIEVVAAGAANARLHVGTSTDINSVDKYTYTGSTAVQNVGAGKYSTSFTPTTTTTIIWLEVGGGAQTQIDFDNIVVKQEDAPRDYSANIKGSGSNKTLTANGNAGVGYEIPSYYGSALSFSGASGDYLATLSDSDFSFGTGDFTVEFWVKANTVNTYHQIFDTRGTAANSTTGFSFGYTSGNYYIYTNTFNIQTSTVLNEFVHLAVERDGSKLTVYKNGVSAGIQTNFNLNLTNSTIYVGATGTSDTNQYFKGQLQDLRVYKGVAKYKGSFDVPKPYTPVGIATWRAVPDTTANNFATTNPLDLKRANGSLTFSDGNLKLVGATSNRHTRTTIGVTSTSVISGSQSKWYWEYYCLASSPNFHHGISAGESIEKLGVDYLGSAVNTWGYWPNTSGSNNAYWRNEGPGPVYGDLPRAGQGDIMMFALDMTSGKVYAGINGTWFKSGNPATGANALSTNIPRDGTSVFPHFMQYDTTGISINFGQNPTFSGNTTAGTFTDSNGKGLFKYQPPSGFLALCEDNLPTPAISDPGKHFKTVLYTGDGNTGRSIVGVGFTPDLVWIKSRTSTNYHNFTDSVRGPGLIIQSNTTTAEQNASSHNGSIGSFDFNGFSVSSGLSVGDVNGSGNNFVAWCWRAGAGTTSTNTDGSIPSVVSVNQDAGFSIVSYTGNGGSSAVTVGHGLGKVPSLIICKGRQFASNWITWHKSLNGGNVGDYYLRLNATDAQSNAGSSAWNNTAPTSTTFTVGASSNTNGPSPMIAYCWAEIEGFSKFGSYVGNGNADGPMVYCGFKPACVITKRTDSTGGWQILDSSRMSINSSNTPVLFPNTAGIELGTDVMDFLSNGFKFRSTGTDYNASGGTYIFAAFAESPFQTANSK